MEWSALEYEGLEFMVLKNKKAKKIHKKIKLKEKLWKLNEKMEYYFFRKIGFYDTKDLRNKMAKKENANAKKYAKSAYFWEIWKKSILIMNQN